MNKILLRKPVAATISGRLSPSVVCLMELRGLANSLFSIPTRWSGCACSKSDSAVACSLLLFRLYWQRLCANIAQTSICLTIMLGVDAWKVLSPESTTEGHRGTEVSGYEDLEWLTTRRNLQVDREFQEPSASLCKRRLRIFLAL